MDGFYCFDFSFWRNDIVGGLVDYQRRNDMDMALEHPPAGIATGKTIVPRARRNLPAGMRNSFGDEE
ncbi:MAG TPA: hypothetical protein DEF34_03270 [Desulfotomaculum sp.]|nr:MAG: hypothetical protein JL56_02890 [Desulfotomaculum sp. BICA1-6]HBX22648.1 hypothetical protein [Desulfotomaculum sp.]